MSSTVQTASKEIKKLASHMIVCQDNCHNLNGVCMNVVIHRMVDLRPCPDEVISFDSLSG